MKKKKSGSKFNPIFIIVLVILVALILIYFLGLKNSGKAVYQSKFISPSANDKDLSNCVRKCYKDKCTREDDIIICQENCKDMCKSLNYKP